MNTYMEKLASKKLNYLLCKKMFDCPESMSVLHSTGVKFLPYNQEHKPRCSILQVFPLCQVRREMHNLLWDKKMGADSADAIKN